MNHTDIIRELQAMTPNTRKTIGNCDVKRDGTGDYWCAQTPRGYTAYYHASGMAAIILSWQVEAATIVPQQAKPAKPAKPTRVEQAAMLLGNL